MHADKLGQVTNFTVVGGTAKHGIDQYTFRFATVLRQGGDTAIPGGLHAIQYNAIFVYL